MKVNKPFILDVPAAFIQGLNNYLKVNPPCFKYEIIYFYYITHCIFVKQIQNKNEIENEQNQYVHINRKLLKAITVSNVTDYIKYLKDGEFIIGDYYIPGKRSMEYRINPIYLSGTEKIEVKPDCKLFCKIIKEQRKRNAHIDRLEPFLKRMRDEFMNIELDYQNAEKWILSQPEEVKRNAYMTSLSLIKDKRFRYFNRNKTNNRLDTNLTNLKSELKQFIIGDHVCIDLKNSQPFLFSMMLNRIIDQNNNNYTTIPLCYQLSYINLVKTFGIRRIQAVSKIHQNQKKAYLVNLKSFNESVIAGTLYDDFAKRYAKGITRAEVKDIMFKVFFSKNEDFIKYRKIIPYEKDKKVFATVHPFIYESIQALKSNDNVLLPVFLQNLESYIFIDCIAKELINTGIVPLTVHDSVIVKREHQEKTIEIINKVFMENFNVIPTFAIEPIKKN
jgi:hypothetical protein